MEKTIYMNRKCIEQVEVLNVVPDNGGRVVHYKNVNGCQVKTLGRHQFTRQFTRVKGEKI